MEGDDSPTEDGEELSFVLVWAWVRHCFFVPSHPSLSRTDVRMGAAGNGNNEEGLERGCALPMDT